ncbi:hypothetical protein [Limnofasciculus baicalensis]|uniref:Uncharacterized protein n=1 Tax=Limnofasciculus baicalensis BBK-W-15 TaxID=2699891 RepID=A0AAE3GTS2_9CYAN|nr:hypothetical protein [Limnofasciculus baicalensis]MCP2729786.1 hypothetical protein [Limnofasciculus baicalensis BBK-W-15]
MTLFLLILFWEDAAKWIATSLESWGTGNSCKGSSEGAASLTIPSSSFSPPEAEKRGTVLITQR